MIYTFKILFQTSKYGFNSRPFKNQILMYDFFYQRNEEIFFFQYILLITKS